MEKISFGELQKQEIGQRRYDSRRNSLNLVRLLAALQVLLGHACIHLGAETGGVLRLFLTLFPGVPLFFMLSGFLVWNSAAHSQTYVSFIRKRFFRVYPELWMAVLIEIAVMLFLYDQPVNPGTVAVFTVTQSTFLQFWTPSALRGYGCGTPNGALWTICTLVQFYLIVWFLYRWLHGRGKKRWLMLLIPAFICPVLLSFLQGRVPVILYKLLRETIFNYLWLFAMGALIAEYREVILPYLKKWWFLLIAAALVYRTLPVQLPVFGYDFIKSILLFCGWVGFAYRVPYFRLRTDLSYGIYLYHMTAVNAFMALGYTGKRTDVVLVLALSCMAAYLSFMTVGRWAAEKAGRMKNALPEKEG